MGVVRDRNKDTGLPPNLWLDYRLTKALVKQHKLTSLRCREPAGTLSEPHANRILADREAQVKKGTWAPLEHKIVTFDYCMQQRLAECFEAGLSTAGDIKQRLEKYVLATFTGRSAASIRSSEVNALMLKVKQESGRAPRTVNHVYDDMRSVFEWAFTQDPPLVAFNPCKLKRPRKGPMAANAILPRRRDKDPRWRRQAKFEIWEIEVIIAANLDVIPIDRLVFYVVMLLSGSRVGEVCGLQVRDYDRTARPLPCLHITEQDEGEELKGGGAPREVPVHPLLWDLLEYWMVFGFEAVMGRPPSPTDFLIPSRLGKRRSTHHMLKKLKKDLARLGLRDTLCNHDARRGFISMLARFKCSAQLVKAITHEGVATDSAEVFRNYHILDWDGMCEEILKVVLKPRTLGDAMLRLPVVTAAVTKVLPWSVNHWLSPKQRQALQKLPPLPASLRAQEAAGEPGLGHSRGHSTNALVANYVEIIGESERGGRDSNPPRPLDNKALLALNKGSSAPTLLQSSIQERSAATSLDTVPVTNLPELAERLRWAGDAIQRGSLQENTVEWRARLQAACAQAAGLLDRARVVEAPRADRCTRSASGWRCGNAALPGTARCERCTRYMQKRNGVYRQKQGGLPVTAEDE